MEGSTSAGRRAFQIRATTRQTSIAAPSDCNDIARRDRLEAYPAKIERAGYSIHKLALTVDAGLKLPALAFVPSKPNGSATLYLHGTSMQADAAPSGPIEALVKLGQIVLAAELRGIGETETGHSYVGMRVEDTAAWTRFLKTFHAAPN